MAKKTAKGVCTSKSVLCRDILNETYTLDYTAQMPKKIPKELIQNLDSSAKKVGTEVIGNDNAVIFECLVGKNKARLSVWDYKGLPLKLVINAQDEDETLQEKYVFSKLIVDGVKSNDVTLG